MKRRKTNSIGIGGGGNQTSAKGDFKKLKRRVGKKAPISQSATNTKFQVKSINVPTQNLRENLLNQQNNNINDDNESVKAIDPNTAVNSRNLTLSDLISRTGHYNCNERKDSYLGIIDYFQRNKSLIVIQLSSVVDRIIEGILDTELIVRLAVIDLLDYLFNNISINIIQPFINILINSIVSGLSHIQPAIRRTTLNILILLQSFYAPLLWDYHQLILPNYINLLNDRIHAPLVNINANNNSKNNASANNLNNSDGRKQNHDLQLAIQYKQDLLQSIEKYLELCPIVKLIDNQHITSNKSNDTDGTTATVIESYSESLCSLLNDCDAGFSFSADLLDSKEELLNSIVENKSSNTNNATTTNSTISTTPSTKPKKESTRSYSAHSVKNKRGFSKITSYDDNQLLNKLANNIDNNTGNVVNSNNSDSLSSNQFNLINYIHTILPILFEYWLELLSSNESVIINNKSLKLTRTIQIYSSLKSIINCIILGFKIIDNANNNTLFSVYFDRVYNHILQYFPIQTNSNNNNQLATTLSNINLGITQLLAVFIPINSSDSQNDSNKLDKRLIELIDIVLNYIENSFQSIQLKQVNTGNTDNNVETKSLNSVEDNENDSNDNEMSDDDRNNNIDQEDYQIKSRSRRNRRKSSKNKVFGLNSHIPMSTQELIHNKLLNNSAGKTKSSIITNSANSSSVVHSNISELIPLLSLLLPRLHIVKQYELLNNFTTYYEYLHVLSPAKLVCIQFIQAILLNSNYHNLTYISNDNNTIAFAYRWINSIPFYINNYATANKNNATTNNTNEAFSNTVHELLRILHSLLNHRNLSYQYYDLDTILMNLLHYYDNVFIDCNESIQLTSINLLYLFPRYPLLLLSIFTRLINNNLITLNVQRAIIQLISNNYRAINLTNFVSFMLSCVQSKVNHSDNDKSEVMDALNILCNKHNIPIILVIDKPLLPHIIRCLLHYPAVDIYIQTLLANNNQAIINYKECLRLADSHLLYKLLAPILLQSLTTNNDNHHPNNNSTIIRFNLDVTTILLILFNVILHAKQSTIQLFELDDNNVISIACALLQYAHVILSKNSSDKYNINFDFIFQYINLCGIQLFNELLAIINSSINSNNQNNVVIGTTLIIHILKAPQLSNYFDSGSANKDVNRLSEIVLSSVESIVSNNNITTLLSQSMVMELRTEAKLVFGSRATKL